jgi:hypothetical protein
VAKSMNRGSSDRNDDEGFIAVYSELKMRRRAVDSDGWNSG